MAKNEQLETRWRIKDLPCSVRPMARLETAGARALSDVELLALILQGEDALGLAQGIVADAGGLHGLTRYTTHHFQKWRGIGRAKAAVLVAMAEVGRRMMLPAADERVKVTSPGDAATLMIPEMHGLEQEHLCVIALDTRNRVIEVRTVYIGSLNTSVIRVVELFRSAMLANAASVIIVHNHPSTDPSPSPEDIQVTRQIVEVGKLLGINVLDHLIIGGQRYVSLKERGLGFDV